MSPIQLAKFLYIILCYFVIQGKYHLSLYYYSQCLNDSNTRIPAMKNSAVIFEKLQNTAAELEMRELIVKVSTGSFTISIFTSTWQVLKEKNDNDLRKRIYLVNGRLSSQCYTNQEQEGLLIATFDLGRRALDFSKYIIMFKCFSSFYYSVDIL